MPIPTDVGYLALVAVLVIIPTAAVLAAVLDRMMFRRRNGAPRRSSSPRHAFPVVTEASLTASSPQPVQELKSKLAR